MNSYRLFVVFAITFQSLLFCACTRPKPSGDTATCALSRQQQLKLGVKDTAGTHAVLIQKLKQLYLDNTAACRNYIWPDIADALFNKAYQDPLADSNLSVFFHERTQEQELSGRNRLKALLVLGAYYNYVKKMPDSARWALDQSQQKIYSFNDSLSRSYHSLMAQVLMTESDLQGAATHYLKAMELAEQLKDSTSVAGLSVNFANLYSRMQEWHKAIAMRHKPISYFRTKGDSNGIFISYVGIGSDYGYAGQFDSARKYNQMAAAMLSDHFQNPIVAQTLFSNIAAIAMTSYELDTAKLYFDKVRALMNQQSYNAAAEVFYLMSSTVAYAHVRDVSKEIAEIKKHIAAFSKNGSIQETKDGYYALYNIAFVQNKPGEALAYYKLWDSLKNVQAGKENLKYVAELETRYQTRQKELTIQYQQQELNARKIQNILLLVLLVSLLLVTTVITTRIQLRRHKRETALQRQFTARILRHTEEERSRIARDLHDDISQNLVLLKNNIRTTHSEGAARIDGIINDVRMISRNLHPLMLDQSGLKYSVEHICQHMMEHNQVFISSDINYNRLLPRQAELHLFRIIQEALNNITRHARAEAARVTITENSHHVIATILDNGIGFNVPETLKKQSSFGLLCIIERCKSLDGRTNISSSEQGTFITIQIPYPHV